MLTGDDFILKKGNSTRSYVFHRKNFQGNESEIKITKSAKHSATLKTLYMTGFLFML